MNHKIINKTAYTLALLYSIFWILIAVVLQTLLFNHLPLFGGVIMVYVIALIKIPVEVNRNIQILTGFICGLIIDIFSNTPGMHAITALTIMWLRIPVLHLYVNAEDVKTGVPGYSLMGMQSYLRYAITILALHCIILYFVESFTLFNILTTSLKALISIVLTFILLLSLEFANIEK